MAGLQKIQGASHATSTDTDEQRKECHYFNNCLAFVKIQPGSRNTAVYSVSDAPKTYVSHQIRGLSNPGTKRVMDL